jgi:hypoxanthine-guanine phosphoribosyltransferase
LEQAGDIVGRKPFPEGFPDVVIQQPDQSPVRVRAHVDYRSAKAGNMGAALRLVDDALDPKKISDVQDLIGDRHPVIVAVHSEEVTGRNKIPLAYAETLADRLGLVVDHDIVHANRPHRTGSSALHRIKTRSTFDGPVEAGQDYVLVDDHISQGGTLADLRCYIESKGGRVIGATTLTGNEKSAKLAPSPESVAALRQRFPGLEVDWKDRFGYGFDSLTQSEADYLGKHNAADSIREDKKQAGAFAKQWFTERKAKKAAPEV